MRNKVKQKRQSVTIVVKNGKIYESAVLPKYIKRGDPGNCFDWCAALATKHKHLQYVEGYATDPSDRDRWVHHAWLTDGTHAFDPTWQVTDDEGVEHPVPSHYFGVQFLTKDVALFITTTGYRSIFMQRWRAPELFNEILERAIEQTKGGIS